MRGLRFVLIALVISVPSWALTQNGKVMPLSLEDAIAMAERRSYELLIARGEVKRAQGRELESLSGFLPSLSLSENYIRSNDPVTVFSLKLRQGIFTEQDFSLSELNSPAALDNFTTALQIQQPLLNLDAIYGKSAARLGVKAQEMVLLRSEEAVVLQTEKVYYGLILARENQRALEDALTSAAAHRDEARAAYEQGMVTKADYLATEVRLAELQEQRISAKHQVTNTSDQLKFVIGLQDESLLVPTDSLHWNADPEGPGKLAKSVGDRSDLQALHYRLKAARRTLWMKRSNWVPRLNAFGSVEWNASHAFNKDASNWAVGLQLKWQFFDGFGNWGRSKQASAEAELVEAQYRQAENLAKLQVNKAERSLQSAKERVQVAVSAVAQAEESHRITHERFKQGLEKTSDLLDKEVMLTNAKLRLLRARHDYAVALSELRFTLGWTKVPNES